MCVCVVGGGGVQVVETTYVYLGFLLSLKRGKPANVKSNYIQCRLLSFFLVM